MTMKTPETSTSFDAERAFKSAWQTELSGRTLCERAFRGGQLADRLSFVFIAAYQCAVRACFELPTDDAWYTFAVSEDRSGDVPGTSLNTGKLTGSKSWIAASENLDAAIVTIGTSVETCLLIERDRPGVTITTQPHATFLSHMSQGRAAFIDVDVTEADRISLAGNFGLAEPFFVTSAALGYIDRRATAFDDKDMSDRALQTWSGLNALEAKGFDSDVGALISIYEATKAIGKQCASHETGDEAADWQADGRLLGLYGKSLAAKV